MPTKRNPLCKMSREFFLEIMIHVKYFHTVYVHDGYIAWVTSEKTNHILCIRKLNFAHLQIVICKHTFCFNG